MGTAGDSGMSLNSWQLHQEHVTGVAPLMGAAVPWTQERHPCCGTSTRGDPLAPGGDTILVVTPSWGYDPSLG